MAPITFIERDMTEAELRQENRGFDEHTIEHNNPIEMDERIGFVAVDGQKFIGCVSGLAYKADGKYNPYFYLSDLYVDKNHRKLGIGSTLLNKLETKIASLGIKYIWTWTSGYEGEGFYRNQGYQVFTEMKDWYPSGHSRFGFIKELTV